MEQKKLADLAAELISGMKITNPDTIQDVYVHILSGGTAEDLDKVLKSEKDKEKDRVLDAYEYAASNLGLTEEFEAKIIARIASKETLAVIASEIGVEIAEAELIKARALLKLARLDQVRSMAK